MFDSSDIDMSNLNVRSSTGTSSGAVAERLRHRSRVQRVPSSNPAWTSVLR